MQIDTYQAATRTTAIYPAAGFGTDQALTYVVLGLTGETGEIANKVKKLLRDEHTPEQRKAAKEAISAEIGDVFWYLARLVDEMCLWSSDVLTANVEKLHDRKIRGALQGQGDDR